MVKVTFPEFFTQRLLLRQIVETDIQKVFEGLSRPEMIQYYGVSYGSLEETRIQMNWFRQIWEEGSGIWWAICQKENPNELIGAIGFNGKHAVHKQAEIGYWLLPEYQRKGLMQEAAHPAIEYAFSGFGLHRIYALVETPNQASSKLLKRLGFSFEGCKRESEWKNEKFIDLYWYGLLAHEWPEYKKTSNSL
jgi:[ribosomal protein S5]-alanine N-acetyltransferase